VAGLLGRYDAGGFFCELTTPREGGGREAALIAERLSALGVDELRWPRPVRPGDTLRLHCEIIEVQESKLRPSRGTVRVRMTTLNQHDQPVQTMVANLLAFRRPKEAA